MEDFRRKGPGSERLVTGLCIGVPVLVLLSAAPVWTWAPVVVLLAGIGLWEFEKIALPEAPSEALRAYYLSAGAVLPLAALLGGASGLHAALIAYFLSAFCYQLAFRPLDEACVSLVSRFILGWLYIPYLLSYVMLIGRAGDGRGWVLFCVVVAVAGDSGAYYTGRALGRYKLYEKVSPKKTVEGSVGGLVGSMAAGLFMGLIALRGVPAWELLAVAAVLSLVGQIGDLVESMLKRIRGVKDSSSLLPGHGGVLDRVDSLLFIFPAAWFYLTVLA